MNSEIEISTVTVRSEVTTFIAKCERGYTPDFGREGREFFVPPAATTWVDGDTRTKSVIISDIKLGR